MLGVVFELSCLNHLKAVPPFVTQISSSFVRETGFTPSSKPRVLDILIPIVSGSYTIYLKRAQLEGNFFRCAHLRALMTRK